MPSGANAVYNLTDPSDVSNLKRHIAYLLLTFKSQQFALTPGGPLRQEGPAANPGQRVEEHVSIHEELKSERSAAHVSVLEIVDNSNEEE